MAGSVICASCGAEVPEGTRFCGTCGAALGSICASCGRSNAPDGAFCVACGTALTAAPDAPETGAESGPVAEAGERKTISVLFADVAGYTKMSEGMDPEDVRGIMQRAFAVMQEPVHRFEGTVSQLLGDGLLALFGAPIAHEDHAQRAIRAGLAIHDALASLREELADAGIDFQLRVGINTGPVVFGQVGTDLESTLQAVGDTVNTASRIQGLAEPGTVVVAESTHRLTEGYFVFNDLGSFEVKNKAAPLHVFRAVRPSGSRSRIEVALGRGLASLVGRAGDVATLMGAYADAREGRGHVVFVSGEPGIGKSRMLYELRSRVAGEDEDAMWLTGRCIAYGQDIAYVPVVDVVKDACGIEEADGEDVIAAKLDAGVAAVGGDAADLPYLRVLLSLDPGDPAVNDEEPALRKAHIFEAFRNVLLAAAERRTVVLAVEDLHWIDRQSAELLSFIDDVVPNRRVLVLLTHRTDWERPFGERAHHQEIRLVGLSDEEAVRLAEETIGAGEMTADVREAVAMKADGNPFFVEEVARALMESPANGAPSAIPDTVQDVIMARIDRLADDARTAIQTASVIGREFTARLLDRTARLGPAAEEGLRELKSTQLIFERSLYPELVYMFKHALTHDVAYASLLKERRRVLHGQVADAIVVLYAERLPELYEIVATHYERAERWPDAAHYLLRAAEKSMAAYAVPEAAAFSERALDALQRASDRPDPVALAEVHELRGFANELLNRWDVTCESYAAQAAAAAEMGDAALESSAFVALASALLFAHRFDEALVAAGRARDIGDAAGRAGALIMETFVHTVEGRMDHVHGRLGELEASVPDADEVMRAVGFGAMCEINHWMGNEQRALKNNDRGMEIALRHEASQAALWNFWDRGLVLTTLGRYEEGLDWLHRHAELCRRVGDIGFWSARSLNTSGWAYLQIDAWDAGRRENEEGLEAAHRRGDPEIIRNALLNLADVALANQDPAGALRVLHEVEASCAADVTRGDEWMKWRYIQHLWASLADAHSTLGEPVRAQEYAERCLADAQRTSSKRYLVRGGQERARALAALGDTDDAVVEATRATVTADGIGSPTLRWRSQLTLGDVLSMAGRPDEAAAAHRVGLAILEGSAHTLTSDDLRTGLLNSDEAARLREGAR